MVNLETAGQRPLTILVADDEPLILRALSRFLELRGHRVATAETAGLALSLTEEETFDVVVADANMPGSGLSILSSLSANEDFEGRLILMTGAPVTDYVDQIDQGVAILGKPFSFNQAAQLVEEGILP